MLGEVKLEENGVEVCRPLDYAALEALYRATDGDNWVNNDNWLSQRPLREWHGIEPLHSNPGRVFRLNLPSNGLSGTIPPEIGDLAELVDLNLSKNSLTGSIPPEIGNLVNLRTLLNLSDNQLTGGIPAQISKLTRLDFLALNNNQLTGNIPAEFGMLRVIHFIYIRNNRLSVSGSYWDTETSGQDEGASQVSRGGSINGSAGQTTARLQGIGPTGIYGGWDAATIWEFGASSEYPCLLDVTPGCEAHTDHARQGSVAAASVSVAVSDDDSAGVTLSEPSLSLNEGDSATYTVVLDTQPANDVVIYPTAQGLTLQPASLTFTPVNWQTPRTVTVGAPQDDDTEDGLVWIAHSVAAFAGSGYEDVSPGSVVVTIRDDDKLEAQPAQEREEEADEPVALTDRKVLEAFYESTGGASWTNNANWLSERPLGEWHGVTVNGQGQVTHLSLRNNNLSGSLPAALGELTSLEVLSLDRNSLTGGLPSELGNLSNLTRLALNRNQLSGSIPSELGNLSNLSIIGLARNSLSGSLPAGLGNLTGLTKLSLHDNAGLSGALPAGFVNIDGLQRLAIANTGMCIPSGQEFDDWLAGIPDVPGRDGLARCG